MIARFWQNTYILRTIDKKYATKSKKDNQTNFYTRGDQLKNTAGFQIIRMNKSQNQYNNDCQNLNLSDINLKTWGFLKKQ